MTKTEQADLDRAIGLIGDLRSEMLNGFQDTRHAISDLSSQQAAHLAVHAERDKKAAENSISKRWVVTTIVAIVGTTVTLTLGIVGLAMRFIVIPH